MRIIEKDGTIIELTEQEFVNLRTLQKENEIKTLMNKTIINSIYGKNGIRLRLDSSDFIEKDKEKISIEKESKNDDNIVNNLINDLENIQNNDKKVKTVMKGGISYTKYEDDIVMNNDLSINKMHKLLPHRTIQSIYLRRTWLRQHGKNIPIKTSAKTKGIIRSELYKSFPTFKNKKTNGGIWTVKEIEQLTELIKNNTNFDEICKLIPHRTIDSLRKKIEQIKNGEIKKHPNYKRHHNMSIEQKKKQSEMMIKINNIASELRKNGVDWNTSLREANKIYKRQKEKGEYK